jgi:hypothetical protein
LNEPLLTVDTSRAALFSLGRLAIERNQPVAGAAGYRALPEAPPLCFFHFPKTAGASIIEWLRGMFPAPDVAPYRTQFEFDSLRTDPQKYRLYAGHMLGRLLRFLPKRTELVTIVRDPVARAVSEYFWIREQLPQARQEHEKKLAIYPDFADYPDYMVEAGEAFQTADVLTAFSSDTPAMRHFFRDPALLQLARLEGEDNWSQLATGSPELERLRRRQWERATRLLQAFSVIGAFGDLEGALLLIAARRGWPAPPPLARHHDLRAPTSTVARDAAIRERFRAMNRLDFQLYDLAMERAKTVRSELEALCGGTTAEAVNRHHRRSYFATAPRVAGFELAAEAPHNGIGWPVACFDGLGQPYRPMAAGRNVSVLARLDPSLGEYRFFCHVFHVQPDSVLQSLTLTVAGTPLPRVQTAWQPWEPHRALVAEWQLPGSMVQSLDGEIEFVLRADLTGRDSALWLGRLGCVPVGPTP